MGEEKHWQLYVTDDAGTEHEIVAPQGLAETITVYVVANGSLAGGKKVVLFDCESTEYNAGLAQGRFTGCLRGVEHHAAGCFCEFCRE